ncbi:MAG: EVE domain-containing protein [Gammaproteobacteria bacterium]|nr:EVE domain-containing protein [Gammaproteobacteria bacterium]
MACWLLKTEPETFGIETLAALPRRTTCWDGVRNYQARNYLRDTVARGDEAFLYHSSCALPGIVGLLRVVRAGYPDHTAFDRRQQHYDAASTPDNPRWYMIDVQLVRRLERVITLQELRRHADRQLAGLQLLRTGNRLSVMPISAAHWRFILSLE